MTIKIFRNKKKQLLILLFLFGFVIISKQLQLSWYVYLRSNIPTYPSKLNRAVKYLRNSIKLAKSSNQKWDYRKEEIISGYHKIVKERIPANKFLFNWNNLSEELNGLPGGYIDFINEKNILGTNGRGEMFILNVNDKKISAIDSNLNNIFNNQNYKGKVIKGLFGRFGLRDLLIDRKNNFIYASMYVDVTLDGCYGLGIFKANLPAKIEDLQSKKLIFSKFFQTKECNRNFNGHASGGRMKKLRNNIIFTVGSLDYSKSQGSKSSNLYLPQKKDNAIGKVISISEDGSKFKVLSLGHRNQQGLSIVEGEIFITEHGPRGGDEINIINGGRHYGWPYYSYGFGYGDKYADSYERYRMPHENGFVKPVFYFTPSIAISEIIFYKGEEFKYWKDKLIVASLKNKSIYILDYDKDKKSIISSERINIGHRLRDLLLMPNGTIFALTDDRNIIFLSKNKKPLHADYEKIPIKIFN